MNVPLLDLKAQYSDLLPEMREAVDGVLESAQFILGPNVAALEEEVADFLGVEHAVGVASGTDALVLSMRALGIGPGDEVILPAYTFYATAGAVLLAGATPVLVDVDPDTYCIDPGIVAERITARTRAVIPVHLYGHPADMAPLEELAETNDLMIIEDNAQAIGAEYKGRRTGGIGDTGCLSFYPTKNLGAYGDAGMVVTNDADTAEQLRMLRTHGWRTKNEPEILGYNSRLDEIQAAILRVKLRHVDAWNQRRRELADLYADRLGDAGVVLPTETADSTHVYHLYVIRVKNRDVVQQRLREAGIASAVYYRDPIHKAASWKTFGLPDGDFPVAQQAGGEVLAIPLYPEMSEAQLDHVADTITAAVGNG